MSPKPIVELEFRQIAAPSWASPGATVYALLPTLEDLVGCPGFGRHDPIALPHGRRRFDPREFFAPFAARRVVH